MRSTGDAAVGMMDAAYFTGRKELLDFFNDLLELNLVKIEQTASGAVACQLTEYIFPGSIPMHRVNWEAKADFEFVQNYKLLQKAFNKHHVKRHVDVDRLIRAKYQDNLEFCQWLKAFHDQSGVYRSEYDPVAARSKGKGAAKVNQLLTNTASKYNSKVVPSQPRQRTAARPATTTAAARTRPTKTNPAATRTTTTRTQKENKAVRNVLPSNDLKTDAILADANLMKKNSELNTRLTEMEAHMLEVEKERDFYFEKLRDVEVMLQVHQEKGEEGDPDSLIENVFKVLYATAEDNYSLTDDGQFVSGEADDQALEELLTDNAE